MCKDHCILQDILGIYQCRSLSFARLDLTYFSNLVAWLEDYFQVQWRLSICLPRFRLRIMVVHSVEIGLSRFFYQDKPLIY